MRCISIITAAGGIPHCLILLTGGVAVMMNRRTNDRIKAAAVSILACLGTVFLCILLFSWLRSAADLPEIASAVLSGIALCFGCFFGAFSAANVRRKHGAAVGFLFGAAVFAVLFLLGLVFVRSFSAHGIFAKAVLIVCSAASGGIIGVNTKPLFR